MSKTGDILPPATPHRGRGALSSLQGRCESWGREAVDDGWDTPAGESPAPATEVSAEQARSIVSRNDSPDIPFAQSVNPYRGCEHGCIYCYARPSHAWLGLSPGLDFETRLSAKTNAAELLRAELARPGYRCQPIALGANTDPYQPVERQWRITRQVIEVLAECKHPLTITTKSALVERDLDLLAPMAAQGLARVHISIATLDGELARRLEPRAAAPHRRLEAIRRLSAAGVPTGVVVAPVIPGLTDKDIERVLEAAREAGAEDAGWVLLRLPHEVAPLFEQWLEAHYPLRAAHVMSLVRQTREGRDNDPRFGSRMRGSGVFAELVAQRFVAARRRFAYPQDLPAPSTALFRPPSAPGQMSLF